MGFLEHSPGMTLFIIIIMDSLVVRLSLIFKLSSRSSSFCSFHQVYSLSSCPSSLCLFVIQDEDDEDVTVSPRVLSPEMDEPAGSFHVRGFHGRCKEPQEKRTAFIALGNLNNFKSPNRNLAGSDEHPATLRARQLVQQIHRYKIKFVVFVFAKMELINKMIFDSLKQKVKLYEDAFEQRYGYRPSHHQKMDDRNTKRVLTELARTRKELKQLKERYHLVEPVEISETRDPAGTTTTATFFTTKERPSAPPCATTPSVEETVLEVQEVRVVLYFNCWLIATPGGRCRLTGQTIDSNYRL
jgi:hypothetical protein